MKKFTKSLAVILSAVMLLSCFTAACFVTRAGVFFTEWTEMSAPCAHVAKADADSSDNNYGNYQYTGQSFIPEEDKLAGISVGFLLTGGDATVRISVFEGDDPAMPGDEANDPNLVVTQDFAFNPGAYANQPHMFDFKFDSAVDVTPGDLYCFTFYFATRDAGGIALAYQTQTTGNPPCFTKGMDQTQWYKQDTFTKPFKLIVPTPISLQVDSMDGGTGKVIAAGNANHIRIETDNHIEGTGAFHSDWNGATGANQKLYLSVTEINSLPKADTTGCTYISFDIYCHGWHYNNVGGTDTLLRIGTGSAWNSGELGLGRNQIKAAFGNIQEGWNHILIQMKKDNGTIVDLAGLNVIGIACEKSIVIDSEDALSLIHI